ncbi:phosphate signaling complex protein PhoU [Haloarcula argentinensis]|uniref:Phosphate-specific transport system accessory protein PhoU n=1 Tax=Haloarcula argentinensis TaxID=43776 RepID=A0ABU2F1S2_HALAR|nr:phosphate signaling complex protein PhoU [Haloarcula argentinensis]EMA19683.1 phosphate transport system regulatory protein PhoU [Haloarcula argentinensis DSM 12282]MDS0254488.1 phosphate signaling complex protein PhoU [Haloarcula argentinensis]
MSRESYQQLLDELREHVVEMGDLVVERLEAALTALRTVDREMAQSVIDGDDEINELYLALEADCIDLFALQQPVATDLRFVAASFKIITDLERVADLATNLAEYALSADRRLAPDVDVDTIGREAIEMVERSIDAYRREDVKECRAIAADDDALDALCQRASETVARGLIEREADTDDGWAVEQLLDDVSRLLLTVQDLERVGDHAVNVAARTLYMVETDSELIY